MKIILYGRPFNRTDRVQWLLEELKLEYEYHVLDIFELEHRKSNIRDKYPLSRVPFVEIDGEVMFESGAIMLYLAEYFQDSVCLLSKRNKNIYSKTLQWLFFAISTLEASDGTLPSEADPAPFAPQADTFNFLDKVLKNKIYIAGNDFTVADIAMANGFKWFDRKRLRHYKNIVKYCSTHMSRPSYQKILDHPNYPEKAKELF